MEAPGPNPKICALCIPLCSLGAANSSGAMTCTRREEETLWGSTELSSQEQGHAPSIPAQGRREGRGGGVYKQRAEGRGASVMITDILFYGHQDLVKPESNT